MSARIVRTILRGTDFVLQGVDLGSESLYADQDNALSPTEEEESGEDEDDSTLLCGKSKFNGPFAAINCIDAVSLARSGTVVHHEANSD